MVDGSTIKVIQDTGAPHDIRDGDIIRIGGSGMEVLLNTYIRLGGAYDRFIKAAGASYKVLRNSLADGKLDVSLLVDCSPAHGLPAGTLVLEFQITATLEDLKLKVTYLSRGLFKNEELYRDQLMFTCDPIPRPTDDMTGTWETTAIRVLQDTGPSHPFKKGDKTIIDGGKITQLLGTAFTPNAMLPSNPASFNIPGDYTNATEGRCDAMFVALGKAGTAVAGYRLLLICNAIRSGNTLVGNFFTVHDDGEVEDIDHLEVWMTLKSNKQAVLGSPGFAADAKKLVTFVLTPPDR